MAGQPKKILQKAYMSAYASDTGLKRFRNVQWNKFGEYIDFSGCPLPTKPG